MRSEHQVSLDELENFILSIKDAILEAKVVLLYGEMGAGKTTFIKQLCASLGYLDEVTSPTYALVNEYQTENKLVYHFDLYRLTSMEEALDIGFEDYLSQDAICLIEWPQEVEPLIDTGLKIEIEKIDFNHRKFSIFRF